MQGKTFCFIGNGVVIHIPQFFEELEALEAKGNLTVLFIVVESILQGGYSRMFYVFFCRGNRLARKTFSL